MLCERGSADRGVNIGLAVNEAMVTVVVLDANALIMPFERRIHLESELTRLLGSFEAVVPESVLAELASIAARGKGRRQSNANAALTLASRFRFVKSVKVRDQGVLEVAERMDAVLVTNDAELRRRARDKGLRTAFLRGLKHLVLDSGD